ncbi:MAG: BTAD domain-containing putative transcriptional regulator [Vulcanimicrobiaceae bacterium]
MLELRLFGPPQVRYDGQPFKLAVPPKAMTLCAYVAAHPRTSHPRDALAYTLWPDEEEVHARANLRRQLHVLSRALPIADGPWLAADSRSVRWNDAAPTVVDVIKFQEALQHGDDREAVRWYTGDFLASLDEPWIAGVRAELREQYLAALLRIIRAAQEARELQAALEAAQRFLIEEPWREDVVREIMLLYAAHGSLSGALNEYSALAERLKRDLDAEPSAETLALARILQLRRAAEPLAILSHLPEPLTQFVGRKDERSRLGKLLDDHRLVTVTGFGGIGKSRLAIAVAKEVSIANTVFVDLSPVRLAQGLIEATAVACGVNETSGKVLEEAIAQVLQNHDALIILDNCDYFIDECATFSRYLLQHCPHLRILCTGREALHVPGEAVFDLRQLDGPDSVLLFAQCGSASNEEFQLTEGNVQTIASICADLEGIPLAIEITAARLHSLPLHAIAESRRIAPQQRTLCETIDWSFNLLSEEERRVFCRLAVFRGGWELPPARYVAGESALEVIERLIQKSLVTIEFGKADGRMRLLETLREYALEKMEQSGGTAQARDDHLGYFSKTAEGISFEATGTVAKDWLKEVQTDLYNFRAALEWAMESRNITSAMRLAVCLGRFGEIKGIFSEGRRLLMDVVELAKLEEKSALFADTLHYAAIMADWSGDWKESKRLNSEALHVRGHIGDQLGVGRSLHNLGSLAYNTGNYLDANKNFNDALVVFRALEHSRFISIALDNLGELTMMMERFDEAQALFQESLAIARSIDYSRDIAWRLSHLGSNAYFQNDLQTAEQYYSDSLPHAKTVDDRAAIAETLRGLARINITAQSLPQARKHLHESFVLYREMDDRLNVPRNFEAAAELGLLENNAANAIRYLGHAAMLRDRAGFPLHPAEKRRYAPTLERLKQESCFRYLWQEGYNQSALDY